jgi:hypothetical protein
MNEEEKNKELDDKEGCIMIFITLFTLFILWLASNLYKFV